ncbi:hypothetical protein HDU98_007784 [Podochytrium sp. JEL0797]|nr:hypothetical protein HDU98_007784 [Podochytrium sp. JEL0797]
MNILTLCHALPDRDPSPSLTATLPTEILIQIFTLLRTSNHAALMNWPQAMPCTRALRTNLSLMHLDRTSRTILSSNTSFWLGCDQVWTSISLLFLADSLPPDCFTDVHSLYLEWRQLHSQKSAFATLLAKCLHLRHVYIERCFLPSLESLLDAFQSYDPLHFPTLESINTTKHSSVPDPITLLECLMNVAPDPAISYSSNRSIKFVLQDRPNVRTIVFEFPIPSTTCFNCSMIQNHKLTNVVICDGCGKVRM